jgi:hypothetical protein
LVPKISKQHKTFALPAVAIALGGVENSAIKLFSTMGIALAAPSWAASSRLTRCDCKRLIAPRSGFVGLESNAGESAGDSRVVGCVDSSALHLVKLERRAEAALSVDLQDVLAAIKLVLADKGGSVLSQHRFRVYGLGGRNADTEQEKTDTHSYCNATFQHFPLPPVFCVVWSFFGRHPRWVQVPAVA